LIFQQINKQDGTLHDQTTLTQGEFRNHLRSMIIFYTKVTKHIAAVHQAYESGSQRMQQLMQHRIQRMQQQEQQEQQKQREQQGQQPSSPLSLEHFMQHVETLAPLSVDQFQQLLQQQRQREHQQQQGAINSLRSSSNSIPRDHSVKKIYAPSSGTHCNP
jgi:hypothetical protein